MSTRYDPDSIIRALDTHMTNGLIRNWRFARRRESVKPPAESDSFRVLVDLVDGESGFGCGISSREASIFVHALASAHHAQLRREQPAKTQQDTFNQVGKFLHDQGESEDWIMAVLLDARFDGSAELLKFRVTWTSEDGYAVTRKES